MDGLSAMQQQQQEQHGGKQSSPNGGDQSLLARVVALEQEKREAVLRAELERAARQAERKEQETAHKIERLEQARALDAAKAEQARVADALKAEIEKQSMRAEMEKRMQKMEKEIEQIALKEQIEQMVEKRIEQMVERKFVQQQMAELQQPISKSSTPLARLKEAGTPMGASAWADRPEPTAFSMDGQPAPVVRSAAQQLQQTVPRADHQPAVEPAQHIVTAATTAATPQHVNVENTISAPESELMRASQHQPASSKGAVTKVPLPDGASKHFFIRLVNLPFCCLCTA